MEAFRWKADRVGSVAVAASAAILLAGTVFGGPAAAQGRGAGRSGGGYSRGDGGGYSRGGGQSGGRVDSGRGGGYSRGSAPRPDSGGSSYSRGSDRATDSGRPDYSRGSDRTAGGGRGDYTRGGDRPAGDRTMSYERGQGTYGSRGDRAGDRATDRAAGTSSDTVRGADRSPGDRTRPSYDRGSDRTGDGTRSTYDRSSRYNDGTRSSYDRRGADRAPSTGRSDYGRYGDRTDYTQRPGRDSGGLSRDAYRGDRRGPDGRGGAAFTRSMDDRHFDRGVYLRRAHVVSEPWGRSYFRHGYAYYPHYAPSFSIGLVYYSPYWSYGICAPYVYSSFCVFAPPVHIWIETPIYVGHESRGFAYDDDYYLNRYDSDALSAPGLRDAVDDLQYAFRHGDIERLTDLTEGDAKIAIFDKGKYNYSVTSNDYLDMTRDMMANSTTVSFDVQRIRRRAVDTYSVSARHVYEDEGGKTRTVYVSIVLERHDGHWTIAQVNNSPSRID